MVRLMTLRFLALAALIVAVGTADIASATVVDQPTQLHRQDLNDDDGDGIPNYLDPDDNNDGIADDDTPAPPVEPPVDTPDPDTPDPETPVDDTDPVEPEQTETPVTEEPEPAPDPEPEPESTQEPTNEAVEAVEPSNPAPQAQPATGAANTTQVVSLPNTGAGANANNTIEAALAIISLGIAGVFAMQIAIRTRRP